MTKRNWGSFVGLGAAGLMLAGIAAPEVHAGVKVPIKDDAYLDLGFRLQVLTMLTQNDIDGDGQWDNMINHRVRRGRLRVKAATNDWFSAFIQTEVAADGGSGVDMRVIDAFIQMNLDPWAQVFVGENMAPTNRQNLTSSGALMAIDRPGIAYHSLNWGNRSVYRYGTATLPGSASGVGSGDAPVRDVGITLFGAGKVGENANLKYYVGTYNGVHAASENSERITARAQLNFFDAEDGYYNSSTYLGKKKTAGIGASIDMMPNVAAVVDKNGEATTADFTCLSVDGFMEMPAGEHTVTAEVGIVMPDFGDYFQNATGMGFYGQAGLLIQKVWQPWVAYEMFSSDDDNDAGNYSMIRIGGTRYFAGQNANIKVGVEILTSDNPILSASDGTDGNEDSALTGVIGFYTTW
ncbi:MAG: hypothetical protein KDA27_06730 [Candidatus Eisenbacteria bacterium]|uniref:Porin n=1 Tax=Eiseniibacteriota bacterium TaxID=2212470 RepID=A0A956NCP4_UNCEI|nr:hypothetical protein [Candidatus Eisenbacteria bacterium]MCB9465473.1 hypothetical protein [Candidatus Eisenbacteria bacterium]